MKRRDICLLTVMLAMLAGSVIGETGSAEDKKMSWWREARFGMFIHWGVYAVPAGVHDGKRTRGNSEWIMLKMKIPVAEYKKYAGQFNPTEYDPEKWVLAAKAAGMKYIVITSKHHDGFALFDSKATDWDVVDASPYGKDLLKPLSEACHKHGMRLGFYYSQAQDWTHPGGSARGGKWDEAQKGSMDEYIDKVAVPQVKEILRDYGISLIWWDTSDGMTFDRADRFLAVLDQHPDILTSSRLITAAHGAVPKGTVIPEKYRGDYTTAERHIPATGLAGDYENCQTMQRSWGYNKVDNAWKSPEQLIRNLIDNASKGGNYLLNVGPKADGTFPPEAVERLSAIGAWMKINGESIYGTKANPFEKTPWGKCTRKALGNGITRLYLHVYNWPADGELTIDLLRNEPLAVQVLGSDAGIQAVRAGDGLVLRGLPRKPVHSVATVIALDIQGEPLLRSSRDENLAWFQDAKFGMFVHWNMSSVIGDEISWGRKAQRPGHPTDGSNPKDRFGKVPPAEYDSLYKKFHPTGFDAAEWADLAKKAGCRYLVFTAKHHDGFCMFDADNTEYKVTNPNSFGRDVCRDLSDAVRQAGLKMGFYYSQPDWTHEFYMRDKITGGPLDGPGDRQRDRVDLKKQKQYIDYMQAHIEQLTRQYGELLLIWWDGVSGGAPWQWDAEATMALCRRNQPGILFNDRMRVGADFTTAERRMSGLRSEPWESCRTVAKSWSYKSGDPVKSSAELIRMLVMTVGRGGNLLLNVGPGPDGRIPAEQAQRMREIGQWLGLHGASIYDTRPGPWVPGPWGVSTFRGREAFVHLLDRQKSDTLLLPSLTGNGVLSVEYLAGGAVVDWAERDGRVAVTVPSSRREAVDTVLRIRFERPLTMSRPKTPQSVPSVFDDGKFGGVISRGASYRLSSSSRYDQPVMHAKLLAGKDYDGEFAFHTDVESEPFIEIDLGKVKRVNGLKIVNRRTAEKTWRDRARNLSISVSEDGVRFTPAWSADKVQDQWDALLERFNAGGGDIGFPARYIRIGARPDAKSALHLHAVTVYGRDLR